MARVLQLRRGTTAENDLFTGAVGELTMDTTTNELRVHDGSTVGGHIIAGDKVTTGHEVIDYQAPTALNNYTWYRKYADGWVEQGGVFSGASITIATGGTKLVGSPVFPIELTSVSSLLLGCENFNYFTLFTKNVTTTGMDVRAGSTLQASRTETNYSVWWEVKGIAA